MDTDHRQEMLPAWLANWAKRKIDLLLVNKQLHREAGRIFWRKNEFRFQQWSDLYSLPFLWGEVNENPNVVPRLVWTYARFSRFQSIRKVSVVGGGWYNQIEYGPEDTDEQAQTSYHSGGIASFLVGFPNLKELLLGVGMVSTFMDNCAELGQRWQTILNVLRRNHGTLKVNFRHILDDNRDDWWVNTVQAKATIVLPVKGVLPLRETVWTLQELATTVQIWINTHKPARFVKFECRGGEHTIWLIGVPQDVVRPVIRERERKAQAKKLKHARHVREGCTCKDCKAMEEGVKEDKLKRMTPLQKIWRPGQTSAHAQLQSKWARDVDISYDEEDVIEAQGSISVNGMKSYVKY